MRNRTILWWGRSDPDYSRNRILIQVLQECGWSIRYFSPRFSLLGDVEARLRCLPRPDLVWLPCFRQRDLAAAKRYCRRRQIPLLADPLISAYDKQVLEREKLAPESRQARRLLAWERGLFAGLDCLLADTAAHANFFHEALGADPAKIVVVPVGAEEARFHALQDRFRDPGRQLEVLFFGSFIPLQGPQIIIDAARLYRGPSVRWSLIGDGPLLNATQRLAEGLETVKFESWVRYEELPRRIAAADILLGIFGATPKAQRVVPNKVYQAAACGRPVVTMASAAYPEALLQSADSGFYWVTPNSPQQLADVVAGLASAPEKLEAAGRAARLSYDRYLSTAIIRRQLAAALASLGFPIEP